MKVFVYGTLKQGYGNHRLLQGKTYVGPALTDIKFDMIGAGFPVVFMCDGGLPLKGEVYDITGDAACLDNLDALEGEGVMYDRREVPVTLADGEKATVSMYIGNTNYWARSRAPQNEKYTKDGVLDWSRQ